MIRLVCRIFGHRVVRTASNVWGLSVHVATCSRCHRLGLPEAFVANWHPARTTE